MKQLSPREIATRVAKESSGVSVKFGKTNGEPVLHLIRRQTDKVEAASDTIQADILAWESHPWNQQAQPRKTKKQKEAERDAA